ncbi:MAG: VOC family protein [Wenzhouxiangellaceae bacterium]
MHLRPFHLAIPVDNLNAARTFYGELLGCTVGRESSRWIDFDFFGHQVTVHQSASHPGDAGANEVDHQRVPVPHFGIILEWHQWQGLAERLRQQAVVWVMEPKIRFAGQVGEQATFFIRDPAGNVLEFKAFRDDSQIFAH